MAHPPPKNSVQMAYYLDQYMPSYESRAFKNSVVQIKNQEYYGTIDAKNLYDNKYRQSPKIKALSNLEQVESEVQAKLDARNEEAKTTKRIEQTKKVTTLRVQSAQRTHTRQSETLRTQFLSNQNLSDPQLQKLKSSQSDSRPLKTGSICRILNKSPGNAFNHLELACSKQLQNLFPPYVVAKEVEAVERIEQRKRYDEDLEAQRRELVLQNMRRIQLQFQRRKQSNGVVQRQHVSHRCSQLFTRLAKPKSPYRPENEAILPEFRDFVSSQIGALDQLKNPELFDVFKQHRSVQRSVELQQRTRKLKNVPEVATAGETNHLDSIDQQNEKDLHLGENHVLWDLDRFDQQVALEKSQSGFSQVKHKEFKYLSDSAGYKGLTNMKREGANYVLKLGREITKEKL